MQEQFLTVKKMSDIICDSSSLITLFDNCLMWIFEELKDDLNGNYVVLKAVCAETVDNPKKSKRFRLKAMRIERAMKNGLLTINNSDMVREAIKLENAANSIMSIREKNINLLHRGESEALAFALKHKTSFLIDERTTRALIEDPKSLQGYLSFKHKKQVSIDTDALKHFNLLVKNIKVIRSSELVALAYENNLFDNRFLNPKEAFEASLYACKFGGCSVSEREIREYLKIFR